MARIGPSRQGSIVAVPGKIVIGPKDPKSPNRVKHIESNDLPRAHTHTPCGFSIKI